MVAESSARGNALGSKKQFETIDEYIQSFPKDVENILEKLG
jgi:hypothetical protein